MCQKLRIVLIADWFSLRLQNWNSWVRFSSSTNFFVLFWSFFDCSSLFFQNESLFSENWVNFPTSSLKFNFLAVTYFPAQLFFFLRKPKKILFTEISTQHQQAEYNNHSAFKAECLTHVSVPSSEMPNCVIDFKLHKHKYDELG